MMTIENNTVVKTRRDTGRWISERIKPEQIRKYLDGNNCFINEHEIEQKLLSSRKPEPGKIKDILQKSLQIETLTPEETAYLLNVSDRDILEEMKQTAAQVKKKVYDNRIVTFAPLYLGNLCVNDCVYCGFRRSNKAAARKKLSLQEVKSETEILAGQIGHKRLIVVYGEHPETNADYIASTIQTIYAVKIKTRKGWGQIRRANVNAAPMSIEELKVLKDIGIGTFQVFQETYHRQTYEKVHPSNTIKGNFHWRLYCMHRAMEAGVDDVGMGVLFGLYDWKFEVMGLLHHAIELEKKMAKKVLMIDDDPEFIEAITNVLDAKGYEIVSASNGKDGVEKAKAENPDIILLDVMMTTESEGFDVAREMHKDESAKNIPVIILTGIRKAMSLPFGFEPDETWLPVKQVLEKPVKPEVLLKAIEENIR